MWAAPSTLPAIITQFSRFLSVSPANGEGSGAFEFGSPLLEEREVEVGMDISTIHLSKLVILPLDVAWLADAGRIM